MSRHPNPNVGHAGLGFGTSDARNERRARHRQKVDERVSSIQGDWGFSDPKVAEAYYRAQRKRTKGAADSRRARAAAPPLARPSRASERL